MTEKKSIILVCCGIVLGILAAMIAMPAIPGIFWTKTSGSQPFVTGPAAEVPGSSDLPQFSSEAEAWTFLESHIEPDSNTPAELTPAPGQLNSQPVQAQNGTRTWHFDVDTTTFRPDEYLVVATAIQQDATATSLFNVLERPSGYRQGSSSATGNNPAQPPNSSAAFIGIDPIADHYVGDRFTITGTTNLAADDQILVEVYSSTFTPTQKSQSGEFSGATGTVKVSSSTKPVSSPTASAQSGERKYSTTNVQVQGVDEADIIKTDGTNIYVVTGNSLEILRAYPAENATVLSSQKFYGTPQSLYINGDRLVLICSEDQPEEYWDCPDNQCRDSALYRQKTVVFVYSVADPAHPSLVRETTLDGLYGDSRMIGPYLYFVTSTPLDPATGGIEFPRVSDSATGTSVLPVYYFDRKDRAFSLTTVGSLNVQSQDPVKGRAFLIGTAGTVYVSPAHLYVAVPASVDYQYSGTTGQTGTTDTTDIYEFAINNGQITYAARGTVNGTLLSQYSMDEYDGNLRVATTVQDRNWRGGSTSSSVAVFNDRMQQIGVVDAIAPNERIYAARFMGDRLYLVTYRETDPFFVIDLSNPAQPTITGELFLTGFSSYLQPYDATHIIGIGKQSTRGGLKIALFDVTNITSPRVVDQVTLGDYGSDSEALRDPKAFLFDKDKDLLVLPVHIVETTGYNHMGWDQSTVWGGAYVFGVDPDKGFTHKGTVIHYRGNSGNYADVKRSLYIDNTLYTMSADKIVMSNITGATQLIGEVRIS